jgi:hypothetical protein
MKNLVSSDNIEQWWCSGISGMYETLLEGIVDRVTVVHNIEKLS